MREYGALHLDRDGAAGRGWIVDATPDVRLRLKRIFPRASTRVGKMRLSDTRQVARELEWVMMRWPLEMEEADACYLAARATAHRDVESATERLLAGYIPPSEGQAPAVDPRPYQLVAAEMALTTGRLLLTDELGLGKTFTALLMLRRADALPALVVTLTHLPDQWLKELNWTMPHLTGHILRKGTPYNLAAHREMRGREPDVLIMNYAKLAGWADHLSGRVNATIFDEAQELRRPESKRYDAAAFVAGAARYRMGLTATPVYNYGGEVHSICEVLAPGELGTREEFAREWGVAARGHVRVKDPGALGVYLRHEGLMLRRTRAEVGRELPEGRIRVTHTIESDAEVFEAEAEGALELAEVLTEREVSREERFRAAGALDWRLRKATGVAKARYVARFVETLLEAGEAILLLGWHHEVYDVWEDVLKEHNPAFYTGRESAAAKLRATEAFLGGDTNLMVMSLRSGAGLDGLQERCHVAVFGEIDWSPAMHDQVIGRLYRDGQTEPVVAYFLVSEEGSDPVVADVLELKRHQGEEIIDPRREAIPPATAPDRIRSLARDYLRRRRGTE